MAEGFDQRLQDYQQRLQELMASAREGVERQAPDVLDKLAATAKTIAQRLEDMASEVRQREGEEAAHRSSTAGPPSPRHQRTGKPEPPPASKP